MLCNYGCGQEAKYPPSKSTRTKWCCSSRVYMCPNQTDKSVKKSLAVKKTWSDPEYKENRINKVNRVLWNDPIYREKVILGVIRAWESEVTGLHSEIRSEKLKKSNKEAYEKNPELREITSKTTKEGMKKYYEEHPEKYIELVEWSRERCKNGFSSFMNSCIKNPSKPQSAIYENVKLLFPNLTVVINYPFLNYSLDTVILEYKIVVEYDGWCFHEGPWGDPKKDIEKQKKCEEYGWKFVRYKGTRAKDIIPTVKQLKQDINKLLEVE